MVTVGEMPQTLGIAGLQLKLLLRKRVILALVTVWIIQALLAVQLGSGVVLRLLLPTLLVADLLVIVMACGMIADDADQGTFPFVLSHGIERRTFLAGKLLPIVALALVFSALAHAATLLVVRSAQPTSVTLIVGQLALASGVSLVRILIVGAVTAFMAVVLTNRYLAAVASLAYIYGLGVLLRSVLSPQSPGVWLAESLLPWRDNFDRLAVGLFSSKVAAGTLAASIAQPLLYAIILGALAVVILHRRDLTRADS